MATSEKPEIFAQDMANLTTKYQNIQKNGAKLITLKCILWKSCTERKPVRMTQMARTNGLCKTKFTSSKSQLSSRGSLGHPGTNCGAEKTKDLPHKSQLSLITNCHCWIWIFCIDRRRESRKRLGWTAGAVHREWERQRERRDGDSWRIGEFWKTLWPLKLLFCHQN